MNRTGGGRPESGLEGTSGARAQRRVEHQQHRCPGRGPRERAEMMGRGREIERQAGGQMPHAGCSRVQEEAGPRGRRARGRYGGGAEGSGRASGGVSRAHGPGLQEEV